MAPDLSKYSTAQLSCQTVHGRSSVGSYPVRSARWRRLIPCPRCKRVHGPFRCAALLPATLKLGESLRCRAAPR